MGGGSSCCREAQQDLWNAFNTYDVHNLTDKKIVFAVYHIQLIGRDEQYVRATDVIEVAPRSNRIVPSPGHKTGYSRKGVVGDPTREDAHFLSKLKEKQHWGRSYEDQSHVMNLEGQHSLVVYECREGGEEDKPLLMHLTNRAGHAAFKLMDPVVRAWEDTRDSFMEKVRLEYTAQQGTPYAHAERVAHVRYSSDLCDEEKAWTKARLEKVRVALGKFLEVDLSLVPIECIPRVGIACSGGGYRAMVASLGVLLEFERAGLLDCVTFLSGTSGGSWLVANAYAAPVESMRELKEHIKTRLSKDFYDLKMDIAENELRERIAQDAQLGVVDTYSWFLAQNMFSNLPTKAELWHKPRLSEQTARIEGGVRPLPILTAVAAITPSNHRWVEMTPYESGIFEDVNAMVPSWGWGRRFAEGRSINHAPEPSLAFVAGCCGSAFCASVNQVWKELVPDGKLRRIVHHFMPEAVEDELFQPALYPNWTHKGQLAKAEKISIMDSGCANNIPIPPLLHPGRKTDVIIALDQSAGRDQLNSANLTLAAEYARRKKHPFPDVSPAVRIEKKLLSGVPISVASGKAITVCPGDVKKGVPTVLYLGLVKNDSFDPHFDPRSADFCATSNWTYAPEEVDKLTGLAAFNASIAMKQIKAVMRDVLQDKRDAMGVGNGRRGGNAATRAPSTRARVAPTVATTAAGASNDPASKYAPGPSDEASSSSAPAAAPADRAASVVSAGAVSVHPQLQPSPSLSSHASEPQPSPTSQQQAATTSRPDGSPRAIAKAFETPAPTHDAPIELAPGSTDVQ